MPRTFGPWGNASGPWGHRRRVRGQVTTYRTDLYTQGSRHPEVRFGDNLREDLARRDFTINAVAADALTGEIVDPFEGEKIWRRG